MEGRRHNRPGEDRRPTAADRRLEWEQKWSRPDFAPGWRVRSVPAEIQEAVETGWLPATEPVLDIGCGSGEIAAWLAREGYDVTGIDFADAAIARARAAYSDVRGLRFEQVDICRRVPGEARYGALIDRGCLHGVPGDLKPAYIRNVAAAAKPGSRFLLLHRIHPDVTEGQVVENLESLCRPFFDVIRVAHTHLGIPPAQPRRVPGDSHRPEGRGRPGVAFWMLRR